MSDSPLFPNFNRLIREQQAALRAWAQAQQSKSGSRQVTRYSSRRSGGGNWLWNSILSKLGDFGQVVDALLRPDGKNLAPDAMKELEAARQVLEAFGQDVSRPEASPAKIIRELVDESKQKTETGKRRDELNESLNRTRKESPLESNSNQNEPIEEPQELIEGMIPVRSSNIHSIGWIWHSIQSKTGDLLVRFLGGNSKNRSGPGPLYRYFNVPRDVFDAFKRAASKGEFLWSEIRVRGSLTATQYDFELEGTGPSGYIPRRLGLKRGQKGEFYLPRNFAGRRSTLPESQARGSKTPLVKDFRGNAKKLDLRRTNR